MKNRQNITKTNLNKNSQQNLSNYHSYNSSILEHYEIQKCDTVVKGIFVQFFRFSTFSIQKCATSYFLVDQKHQNWQGM